MSWGTLTVGRLTLKESYGIQDATNAQSGVRTVTLAGRETSPALTVAQIQVLAEDLTAVYGKILPITFSHKTDRNGYYYIDDVNTSAIHWEGEAASFDWSLALTRIGPDNATAVESRLANVVRANSFSLTGERWHAPATGHYAYDTGATAPTVASRLSETGAIVVYRGIPAGVNPRWGCSVASFNGGRVRLLMSGVERAGTGIRASATGWELNNGLVKVAPAGDTLVVSAWTNGAWQAKAWRLGATVGGITYEMIPAAQMTVLRNDNECVTIRLLSTSAPGPGSTLADLTLRRGSRFVEGYIQRNIAAEDIKVRLATAEAFTDNSSSGYVVASGDDADGSRFIAGSAKTFAGHANGGITKTATATLDFFLGVVPGGELANPANNAGFEGGSATGWTATGGTIVASQDFAKNGSWSGKLSASGSGAANAFQVETVTALQSYRLSGWLYAPVALPTQATISLSWYAPGTVFLSSSAINVSLVVGSWNYLDQTFTAPATAVSANKSFTINGAPPAGRLLYGDDIRLRKAPDSGDAAVALRNQYIAVSSESTVVIPR